MSTGIVFASEDGTSSGLDPHVESFVRSLRAAGYAQRTLRKKRRAVAAFVRWMRREQVSITDADERHVAAFLQRGARRPKHRHMVERAALGRFLDHLRAKAGVAQSPPTSDSPAAALAGRYADYLRNERGLTEQSIYIYLPFIRGFLASRVATTGSASPASLDAQSVRDFLLDRVRDRPSEYARLLATTLRSFLRFLFLRGETELDLSLAIPTVRRWSQAPVHAFFSPDQVEQILSATDRMTPSGRRDHAILLILARLGLRAGEVVALELGDIRWRTGEILVQGKGRVVDRLPLLSDVGEALALYIQKDRGASASRRVFLRMLAPRVGLAGPSSVGSVVRAAAARAGIRRPHRGAAHLFRHSLATRMIRNGASIAQISEVLRHRSPVTTAIYAKVAFETLRGVARSWPRTRGDR